MRLDLNGDELIKATEYTSDTFGNFALTAGTTFDLLNINPSGFSSFAINGIDTNEALAPTNPQAFVTGLTFTTPGSASISQVPIVTNIPGTAAVPEPMTILGSITALGFGARLKRRLSQKLK